MVRKYPHEVTIYEGGPMTNLALAISSIHFPWRKILLFMGGSLSPRTLSEFANNPRHEFNFWFDPRRRKSSYGRRGRRSSAAHGHFNQSSVTPDLIKRIEPSGTAAARYVARFMQTLLLARLMWDELAAAA
jgi:inosine-uridine nucleoside N-ribohydrolase